MITSMLPFETSSEITCFFDEQPPYRLNILLGQSKIQDKGLNVFCQRSRSVGTKLFHKGIKMGLVNGFMRGFAMAVALGKEGDVVVPPCILIGNTAEHQQHKGQGAGSIPSHQAVKGHRVVGGVGEKQKDVLQSLLHLGKTLYLTSK